jgi:hypothetical protein
LQDPDTDPKLEVMDSDPDLKADEALYQKSSKNHKK